MDFTQPVAAWPPPDDRIQFSEHHPQAERALARVAALPAKERADLISDIGRTIQPFPTWLAALNQRSVTVLCVGENHEPYLRRFLADRLFATLKADVLLLEATSHEARRMRTRVEAGDEQVMLLDADIARLLRSALTGQSSTCRRRNRRTKRAAISTRRQQGTGIARKLDRNQLANPVPAGTPSRRAVRCIPLLAPRRVALSSACAIGRFRTHPPNSLVNLRVAWEHVEAPFEAFVYFLDEVGLAPGDFVITDPESLADPGRRLVPLPERERAARLRRDRGVQVPEMKGT